MYWCNSLTLVEHSAVNRVVARSSRAGGAIRASAIAGAFNFDIIKGRYESAFLIKFTHTY